MNEGHIAEAAQLFKQAMQDAGYAGVVAWGISKDGTVTVGADLTPMDHETHADILFSMIHTLSS